MKKDNKKIAYVLCPRCELNYINAKDKYCTVCKAELGLVDPSVLLPDDDEAGLEKLCPVCHLNYIGEDEDMCFLCQKERDEREAAEEKDEWAEIDRDPDDGLNPIGILPLDDEPLLDDDSDEEEEEEETVHDDFDYPDFDESELTAEDDELDDEEDELDDEEE